MNDITTEKVRAIVRPVLTLMFSFAFVAGCVMGAIDSKYLVWATLGTLAFWFGERYFGKFISMITSQNQGAVAAAAPPEVASPTSLPPAVPPAVPVIEAPPEPLDVKAFHERVLAEVGPKYTDTNPTTIFYEARDKGSVTDCANINQAQDYWDYLVSLAYAAEAYVKEQTEQKTAAAGGCKGVADPAYVQMVQDLNTTIRNRDYVYALARANIDWKAALGTNATLYQVGVQAEHLIKAGWEA
jgi:hypothetical protein